MTVDRATAAADSAPWPAAYCRGCGYWLRGLAGGKCPECGGAFDLADRRTFARRPPRVRLKWWAWRVSILLTLFALGALSVPGWYWWRWRAEQTVLGRLNALGARVETRRLEAAGAARYLPARWAFLLDRVRTVDLANRSAEEVRQLDLGPLSELESVFITSSPVGPETLARLGRIKRLRHLSLSGNPLDGSGLAQLAGCGHLESLFLSWSELTDASLAEVGEIKSLHWLEIPETNVTDAGIAHLSRLKSLEALNLDYTGLTDAGLLRLRGLGSLRVIDLHQTKVTVGAIGDFKRARRDVLVRGWGVLDSTKPARSGE